MLYKNRSHKDAKFVTPRQLQQQNLALFRSQRNQPEPKPPTIDKITEEADSIYSGTSAWLFEPSNFATAQLTIMDAKLRLSDKSWASYEMLTPDLQTLIDGAAGKINLDLGFDYNKETAQ